MHSHITYLLFLFNSTQREWISIIYLSHPPFPHHCYLYITNYYFTLIFHQPNQDSATAKWNNNICFDGTFHIIWNSHHYVGQCTKTYIIYWNICINFWNINKIRFGNKASAAIVASNCGWLPNIWSTWILCLEYV